LTIKNIRKTDLPNAQNRDCYLIEVEEKVIYSKGISQEVLPPSHNIYTFQYTYKNRNEISKDREGKEHDVFYYFVYYLGKKIDKGIPFRALTFSTNRTDRIFHLSDTSDFSNQENKDINDIIKEEKKK